MHAFRPGSLAVLGLVLTALLPSAGAEWNPAPGDEDPLFHYPLPAVLVPDSSNLVGLDDGFIVIRSVMPDPPASRSTIELMRIDLDGRAVPSYGEGGRLSITVPAPVNVSGAATWLGTSLLLGGYQRTESGDTVAALILVDENGQLDTSFGNAGVLTFDADGNHDRVADLMRVPDPINLGQSTLAIAVWSQVTTNPTGCAIDRAALWLATASGSAPEEAFAQVRSTYLASCKATVSLGSQWDENDIFHVLLGTQLGIYDLHARALVLSGGYFGPFAGGLYSPIRYLLVSGGSIRFVDPNRPATEWVSDPSLATGEPTTWQALAYPFAAFATDGGRVGVVKIDEAPDELWVTVQDAGRDGERASGGLANDVRYFGYDATEGLVVATSEGVIRRYVAASFVSGGRLSVRSPSQLVERRRQSLMIKVERNGHAEGAVTVSYQVGGKCEFEGCMSYPVAKADRDFKASSGVLTWASGDREPKFFPVEILDAVGSPAVIPLTLGSATGGASLGADHGLVVLGAGGDNSGSGALAPGSGGSAAASRGNGGGGSGDAWLLTLLLACVARSCRRIRKIA